jgi:hypothetical protein
MASRSSASDLGGLVADQGGSSNDVGDAATIVHPDSRRATGPPELQRPHSGLINPVDQGPETGGRR